jgi:hypothetical protein
VLLEEKGFARRKYHGVNRYVGMGLWKTRGEDREDLPH